MTDEELIAVIRSAPWSDGFPYLRLTADRIEALKTEVARLKAGWEDANAAALTNACREAIRALPAVAASQTPDPVVKADRQQSVRVKPLRFIEADGLDIDHMRERARQDPLSREGDMRLVWVNEGDLYSHTIFLAAIETQPDPRDAVIAQLVEAIGSAVKWTDQYRWSAPWTDDARAALSAAKGGAA